MQGQRIVLNIDTQAPAAAPRIDMNSADDIAVKIRALKHAVSARQLTEVSGGGVSGRCRLTGLPLVPKGAGASSLQLTTVAGMRALGLSTIVAASLGLPAGSQTASYTMVAAVAIGQADIDSASNSASPILVGGSNASDAVNLNVLQYFGAVGTPPNIFTSRGSGTSSPFASVVRPAGSWVVVVVDYNNDTKVVSIAVNQAAKFATATKATSHVPGPSDYLEIGNHASPTNSLRASKVGDLYTFDSSMLATDLGKSQLVSLVAALKTEYAIA